MDSCSDASYLRGRVGGATSCWKRSGRRELAAEAFRWSLSDHIAAVTRLLRYFIISHPIPTLRKLSIAYIVLAIASRPPPSALTSGLVAFLRAPRGVGEI